MTPLEEKALQHAIALLDDAGSPLYSASCHPGNATEANWKQLGRDTVKDVADAQEKITAAKGWLETLLAK